MRSLFLTFIGLSIICWAELNGQNYFQKFNYPSGKQKCQGMVDSAGSQIGNWTFYHENGEVESLGSFINGKNEGVWNFYDTTGNKLKEVVYQNGIYNGKYADYKPTGEINSIGYYKKGAKINRWRYFGENGKIIKIEYYKKTKLYKEIIYG
jgi:antitoxin component YwqK of YwqJK toxin-antitoxin module